MMTPKDLLDTMLGYLGFVVQIEETTNEGGNPTLQIYTEECQRLIATDFVVGCSALGVGRFRAKPRHICPASRAHVRPPLKFRQKRVVFSFYCVGNDFAKHRRKLKTVSAITRSND